MQKGRRVLVDLDAVAQQLGVQGLGGPGGQSVVHLALQQQPHLHAAACRVLQRAAEPLARVEVGADQVHPAARATDRIDIGMFDGAPAAQVVTHHEGGADRLQRGRAQRQPLRAMPELAQPALQPAPPWDVVLQRIVEIAAQPGARPDRAQALGNPLDQRAAQLHREVQPRLLAQAVMDVETVVDQVDAADEGHLVVDDTELLVQPPQLARLQPAPPAVHGPEHRQRHAAAGQALFQPGQAALAAEAVDDDAHAHATAVRREQRIGQRQRRRVMVKDIGGQPDLGMCALDRGMHAWEELVAAAQQLDLVGADKARFGPVPLAPPQGVEQPHSSASSTSSGRWSDMRAQVAPRGTCTPVQRSPRR
mmetsp:Transcript_59425/g.140446  ORF Transcript_59425/g.140446 Transcript_59425/m.140446 type:complete len:364 (-) Transcript_59425:2184-3275(-)